MCYWKRWTNSDRACSHSPKLRLLHLQEGAHEQDQFSQDIGMTCGSPVFFREPLKSRGERTASNNFWGKIWCVMHGRNLLEICWNSHPFWPPLGHCHTGPRKFGGSLPPWNQQQLPGWSFFLPPKINMSYKGPFQKEAGSWPSNHNLSGGPHSRKVFGVD